MNSKQLLTALLILSSLYSIAQSTINLDQKFGFKNLKFRTPPVLSKCTELDLDELNPKIKYYEYSDPAFNQVDGIVIASTILKYYDKKLVTIIVNFHTYLQNQYDKIGTSLGYLYGSPSISDSNGMYWGGEKVGLGLIKHYEVRGVDTFGIRITDLVLDRQITQEEY